MITLLPTLIYANSETIKDIFPNQKFAEVIAKKLNKSSSDSVSQDELDTITGATVIAGASKLDSIEGIGRLSNLKGIIISGSNLNEIPAEIKELKNLAELDINGSEISSLPEGIKNLKALKRLDLAQNKIISINDDYTTLSNLVDVDFSQNKIEKYNLKVPTATKINLSNNKLLRFPDSILASKGLKTLDLSNNELANISLELDNLNDLSELDISTNKIVEKVPLVALKEGKIDKYSLSNHSQLFKFNDIYLYNDSKIDESILMPDLLKQLMSDSGDLTKVASWIITKPNSYTKTEMVVKDGSEVDFNSALFADEGEYTVELTTTNKSMRYWGYSSYITKVIKINDNAPKVDVSTNSIELFKGESFADLVVSYNQGNTLNVKVDNENIINYDNNIINTLAVGETKIRFSASDSYSTSKEVVVNVKVKEKNKTMTIKGLPKEIYVGDKFTLVPSEDDQVNEAGWSYDKNFFSATFNSPATFTSLKAGKTNITYVSKKGNTKTLSVTIKERENGQYLGNSNLVKTGINFLSIIILVSLLSGLVVLKSNIRKRI